MASFSKLRKKVEDRLESGRYDPDLWSAFQANFVQKPQFSEFSQKGLERLQAAGLGHLYDQSNPAIVYASQNINKGASKWLANQYEAYVKQQKAIQGALGGGPKPQSQAAAPKNNLAPFMGGNAAMGNKMQLANQLSAFYGAKPNMYVNRMNETYNTKGGQLPSAQNVPVQLSQFYSPQQKKKGGLFDV